MTAIQAYRLMYTSRYLDEKMLILLRQGKSFFHIGCMGHEAIQAAVALNLIKKQDWLFPYYRDQCLCLGLGMTPEDILLGFLAREGDPSSNGRQMPQHFGHAAWNIPTSSSPTGTQFLQAVGCALASKRLKKKNKPLDVTVVCSGDGTTSQGDFHEALNWASREQAPILFLVENNHYAISVPLSQQRADAKISTLGRGYAGLTTAEVDGCDFSKSFKLMSKLIPDIRAGKGPVLVDANVVRLLPHSSSDDQKKYRTKEELHDDKERDPVYMLRALLKSSKQCSESELHKLEEEIKQEVEDAADRALAAPMPARDTATRYVLSEEHEPEFMSPSVAADAPETVLVDAINRALHEEMKRDPKVLVFGQDVAGGKGGVFTATRDLTKHLGGDRCFNAPLAESSIVGVSIGLAFRGFKPVPEIQFGDYIWTAMMQIRNEVATIRYRSNNMFSCPMVIRVPIGGYIHGGLCHSQNIEAIFAHIPGLKIALPSTALEAYGLLKTAIRGSDPVLFLEHKGLYRQNFAKSQLPTDADWLYPFGRGLVRQAGEDITIISYGALMQRAVEAARVVSEEGISVEIIDLVSIRPLDWELIEQSVKKTGRVLVVYEDNRFMGFGAEIMAQISEKCFEYLDAPLMRLAAEDSPVPFNSDLEEEVLPQLNQVVESIRHLAQY